MQGYATPSFDMIALLRKASLSRLSLALPCIACNALQGNTMHCTAMQCVALQCSAMHNTAQLEYKSYSASLSSLHMHAVPCHALRCDAVRSTAVQCIHSSEACQSGPKALICRIRCWVFRELEGEALDAYRASARYAGRAREGRSPSRYKKEEITCSGLAAGQNCRIRFSEAEANPARPCSAKHAI